MHKAQQFTTFVSRLRACADNHNLQEATKVITEGKLIMRLPQLLPKDQMTVLQCFDKLGIRSQELWEVIASTFNQSLQKKLPFEIANMGSLVARHVKDSSINWRLIENRIMASDRTALSFDPYLINIHAFFATHNKGSDAFWNDTESLCIESLKNAKNSSVITTTLNNLLSKLIWAYSTKKKGSDKFWEEIAQLSRSLMTEHTPKTYGKMILAISKVKQLPDSLKKELAKQATYHLVDAQLTLQDIHDIMLGLNNIDPLNNQKIAEEVASVLSKKIKSFSSFNGVFFTTVHRIMFELIEVSGLKEDKRIEVEDSLVTSLNNLGNLAILPDLEDRALMYFSTLPQLQPRISEIILKHIYQKSISLDYLINAEPGDYGLIINFLKIAKNPSLEIASSIEAKDSTKQAFVVNKMAACLAKYEVSKVFMYPPSFIEELTSSSQKVLREYQHAIGEGILPAPLASASTSKYLFSFLEGETSERIFLRQLARMYVTFEKPQLSDAICQILTVLYLRHQENVSPMIEAFVLQHQHMLVGSPFLLAVTAAIGSKGSKKDKHALMKLIDSNKDQLDHIVLANSLILFRCLTIGKQVLPDGFAKEVEKAKEFLPQIMAEVQSYLDSGTWSTNSEALFSIGSTKTEQKQENEAILSPQEEFSDNSAHTSSLKPKATAEKDKDFSKTVELDPLASYLEKKYPQDPDFPARNVLVIAKNEVKGMGIGPKSKPKKSTRSPSGSGDNKDLIFTESSKKSSLSEIDKIRLSK
jgi:hypothetical protein